MENNDKKCWICLKIHYDASYLPINYGKHHNNYILKWENATNKKLGVIKTINGINILDFSDELCAPICFTCAH